MVGSAMIFLGAKSLMAPAAKWHTEGIICAAIGSVVVIVCVAGFWYLVRSPSSDQRPGAVPFPRQHPSPTLPPPGWYPDPSGARAQRYWDGTRWGPAARP
jgi:hypothetical protein